MIKFGSNLGRLGLVGAAMIAGHWSHQPAMAQGGTVVLPGDVPIAGSSTRGTTSTTTTTAPTVAVTPLVGNPGADLENRLNAIDEVDDTSFSGLVVPGITSNTPVAYGGFKGDGAIGLGYQDRVRFANADDTVAAAVISFGSPAKVGLDMSLDLLDLSSQNGGGFGRRTSLSFKAHKPLKNGLAVALGVDNAFQRNRTFDSSSSFYGVVSKQIKLKPSNRDAFSRLYLSLGVGNGRFRSENDVLLDRGSVGVFGSAAIQVVRQASLFAEWTGQDLNVGASIVPFKKLPIIVTPALADLTDNAGDGTRFTLGVAYRFRY